MKITTNKIIKELVKQGHEEWFLKSEGTYELIRDIRNIINEILIQQKSISIKGK
jgi:hypothetical protein